ncbi:MAG TPA: HAD family hydrolase [Bacillaceae bacterium]|nr:HAD family hydrolase [Bacillaceae bacterium]
MAKYQALFLDIDGTILKPDHTYDESTKDAIKQARNNGVEVFLATGRPLHEISELADELDVHSFIGYNGALAIYKDEVIVNEPMQESTIHQFLQIAEKNNHDIVLYTSEKNYFNSLDKPEVKGFIEAFNLQKNDVFTSEYADKILGATLINLKDEDPALYEIDSAYHFSQVNVDGLRHCYDVIRDSVNKGRAIIEILKLLNIPIENAIAFGDGLNDKEMLQVVGAGFAMGNANPKLFEYAKYQTTSVEENGIFNGLKTIGLVK